MFDYSSILKNRGVVLVPPMFHLTDSFLTMIVLRYLFWWLCTATHYVTVVRAAHKLQVVVDFNLTPFGQTLFQSPSCGSRDLEPVTPKLL